MSAPSHAERHGQAGANTAVDPENLEVSPGFAHAAVQGWVPDLASDEDVRKALETAFDYRGDVTITCKDARAIEGYIFDRTTGATLQNSFVRVMPSNGGARQKIAYADIAALAFTGRDTAAGKSWEAWVRKYWEKKGVGEAAPTLEPEPIE
ncbi:MAG: hypothetical protein ABSG69_04145 [Candidatus Acidiferrum sp.]|jgi:hypothetical protein